MFKIFRLRKKLVKLLAQLKILPMNSNSSINRNNNSNNKTSSKLISNKSSIKTMKR
jgi:hypothetical protein